jgi:tRNA pseudouridine55 synthase
VRAGEDVTLPARAVHVAAFEVLARRDDDVDVTVACSSGTYVRALARDLGAALGVGAHLTALRRTRVGPFALEEARTLEELEKDLDSHVLVLDDAVAQAFPRRELSEAEAVDLSFGRRLQPSGVPGVVGAFDGAGRCVALLEDRDEAARPAVVFRPA